MLNKNPKLSSLDRRKRSALLGGALALMASGPLARAGDLPDTKEAPAAPDVSLAAQAPAPLGVFGVGLLNQGQWAVSYAPSWTRLAGNQIGTDLVSPEYIINNVYSSHTPKAGYHLLRMVPHDLEFFGQNASAAYGVTNDVTLIVATTDWEKWVNMQTFYPATSPKADDLRGTSTGHTDGIGDTLLAGVWRVYRDDINQINVNMGFSLPTGSTTADEVLFLPNGTAPIKRAFYGMQLGTERSTHCPASPIRAYWANGRGASPIAAAFPWTFLPRVGAMVL